MSDAARTSSSSEAEPREPIYSALVVGSGFGASVLALRLAQAYAGSADTVCVLERGRRYEAADFPRLKLPDYLTDRPELRSSRRVPDGARHLWGVDQGLFDVRSLGRLQVVQAAGLGGGSLIYAGVHLRPPHAIFDSWPAPYRDRRAMDRAFARVHEVIGPQPLPQAQAAQLPKTRLMHDAAARLGLSHAITRPPLAIHFGERAGELGACNGCGNCTLGCQEGAKRSLDKNYLARAIAAGAEVKTLCEVTRLAHCGLCPAADGGGHYRVEYFDHLERRTRQVCARAVFLGAGALGTTELLMRSREALERADGPRLSQLGQGFYANGDSLGAVFDTREPAAPSVGPTITCSVAYAEPDDPARWFLLQDGGLSRDLAGLLGLFRSPLWLGRNRWTRAARLASRGPARTTAPALWSSVLGRLRAGHAPAALPAGSQSQAWLGLLPPALRGPFRRGLSLSDQLRSELRKLDRAVLHKLAPETLFLSRLVDQDSLLEQVAGATAELYPALARLLRKDAGIAPLYDLLKWLVLARQPTEHALLLLAMGPDQRGSLRLREGKLRVDWEEDANVELYTRQEQLMRDFAVALGGELRTNPSWTLGRTPVSVHVQGGCSMAEPGALEGVTEPDGQVRGCPGLYVVDAAAFPSSVGVNPSASIAAVAELKAELFVGRRARLPLTAAGEVPQPVAPVHDYTLRSKPLCLTWKERLSGCWTQRADAQPARLHGDAELYRAWEQAEDPTRRRLVLELEIVIPEAERVLRALSQHLAPRALTGSVRGRLYDGDAPALDCRGQLRLCFDPGPDGFERDVRELAGELAQSRARVRELVAKHAQLPAHRLIGLEYALEAGELRIESRKFFHDDPGHDVWPDLTTLFIHGARPGAPARAGIVRAGLSDVLGKQLPSFDCFVEGEPQRDPRGGTPRAQDAARYVPDEAVRSWLLLRFGAAFFASIKDTYERWY